MSLRAAVALLLLPLSLAACTGDDEVATTPEALAWLAAEHVGTPDTAVESDTVWLDYFDDGAIAVDLRFGIGDDGRFDPGDSVQVLVGTGFDELGWRSCDDVIDPAGGCTDLDGGGVWFWQPLDPEEDPGYVQVAKPKGDTTVLVSYGSGAEITRDPSSMDLPVPVDDLIALAEDPRVDLTTDQEAVDEGADLDYWKGSSS